MEKPKNRLWEIKRRPLLLALLPLLFPAWAKGQSATPSEAMALEQQGKLEEAAQVWMAVTERAPAANMPASARLAGFRRFPGGQGLRGSSASRGLHYLFP